MFEFIQLFVDIIMIMTLLCINLKNIITGNNMDNISSIQKIHGGKCFDFKGPKKSESMPNYYTKLSQELIKSLNR